MLPLYGYIQMRQHVRSWYFFFLCISALSLSLFPSLFFWDGRGKFYCYPLLTKRWQIGFRIASRFRGKNKEYTSTMRRWRLWWWYFFSSFFFISYSFLSSSPPSFTLFLDGRDFRPFPLVGIFVSFFRFATVSYSLAVDCILSSALDVARIDLSLSVWIVVAVWIMDKRHAALGPVLTLYNVLPRGAGGRERERERERLWTFLFSFHLLFHPFPLLFFICSSSCLFQSCRFFYVRDLIRCLFISLPSFFSSYLRTLNACKTCVLFSFSAQDLSFRFVSFLFFFSPLFAPFLKFPGETAEREQGRKQGEIEVRNEETKKRKDTIRFKTAARMSVWVTLCDDWIEWALQTATGYCASLIDPAPFYPPPHHHKLDIPFWSLVSLIPPPNIFSFPISSDDAVASSSSSSAFLFACCVP